MVRRLVPVALALGVVMSAPAADAVVAIAVPGSYMVGYATPQTVTAVGGPLAIVNGDTQPHNFIALQAKRPNGSAPWCSSYQSGKCPLFWSEAVGTGGVTTVEGLDDVESGKTYLFYCSLHPSMIGTLNVI